MNPLHRTKSVAQFARLAIHKASCALTSVALLLSVMVAVAVTGVIAAPEAGAVPAPPAQQTATGVTADALPTVQINGVVWSQAVVGNTVYVGGNFANARPAGCGAGHEPDHALQPARLQHHHRRARSPRSRRR